MIIQINANIKKKKKKPPTNKLFCNRANIETKSTSNDYKDTIGN